MLAQQRQREYEEALRQQKQQQSQARQSATTQKAAAGIRMARQALQQDPARASQIIDTLVAGVPGGSQILGQVQQDIKMSQMQTGLAPGQNPEQYRQRALKQLSAIEDRFVMGGALQPEGGGEPFTLASGARRYGPNGEMIAENPADQSDDTYTLAPGAQRYRGSTMIAENPDQGRRQTAKDRNDILRYVDNGEPVFPGVEDTIEELRGRDYNTIASGLRTEILRRNADFEDIANSWDRISASEPTAAGDLALIFNYMKMLDPGSTVREGEFANAQNAAGVPERVRAWWNNVKDGQRLTPEQRSDFLGQAQELFTASKERADQITNQFVAIGERLGVRPEDIRIDRGSDPIIGDGANRGGQSDQNATGDWQEGDSVTYPDGRVMTFRNGQWVEQ